MDAGFSRMNCLTVIQTSQGLAQYLLDSNAKAQEMGIVIGFDNRYKSPLFAGHTAAVFKARGFKIYWYEAEVHTPLVPFGVQTLGACAGIMITASHNPPEDNGYKVYGMNGCQINAPVDELIAASILQNLEPITWEPISEDDPSTTKILGRHNLRSESSLAYMYYQRLMYMFSKKGRSQPLPRFVYTPLHGVGYLYMLGALTRFLNHKSEFGTQRLRAHALSHTIQKVEYPAHERVDDIMIVVQEQAQPNPRFPTVKSPNPEEAGTLLLAMATADKHNIDLILANDPDADRLAVAEKVAGHWRQFTGDQVGVLLGYYMFEKRSEEPEPQPHIMVTSVVSSQMLGEIGRQEGFTVEECLTGFKWLGNRAYNLGDNTCSFGYEEALGYMIPNVCFDKDGVAAALLFLQMCNECGSPWEKLQSLYKKYGYFVTKNTYWRSPDVATTESVFERIRGLRGECKMYPRVFAGHPVVRWRDLKAGYDSGRPQNLSDLPSSGGNEMITFWLGRSGDQDGIRFTIRSSGTEPKIKGKS